MADLNVLATFPHYMDHMLPIIDALRDRGVTVDVWSTRRECDWGEYVHRSMIEHRGRQLWLVASSIDAENCQGQRLVYLEHGAGQTYEGDVRSAGSVGYSSGRLDDAVMFLCPNMFVLTRRRVNHRGVPALLVGSPKMDQFYRDTARRGVRQKTIAVAWHWDCHKCDESRSAWEYYRPMFNAYVLGMRRAGYRVVGHAHPRIAKRARWHYERHGIEWWDHDQVLYEAAALVVDNSSIGYEFASLDRPVLWLDAPWYRHSVHHGLRFWEYVPGPHAVMADAYQWIDATIAAVERDECADLRRDVSDRVFPLRDGRSAERAAVAVTSLL